MAKLQYNIIAVVGTGEADLAPYPRGSATVPPDKYRKIYAVVLSNGAATTNTLTIRIYMGTDVEAEVPITLGAGSTISVVGDVDRPVLVVPPGRTLRAAASASSVGVLMTAVDE